MPRRLTSLSRLSPAARVSLGYLLLATLWILLSDAVVLLLTQDPALVGELQSWKGQFFVAFTSIVLFLLLRSEQRRLDSSERRWRFAIDGSELGLWDWDIAAETVYFSPQWKRMLGYDEDDIGNSLQEWESRVHPDDLPGTLEDVQRHLRGESPMYSNEHRMLCKNGEYRWILDRGKVVVWSKDSKPLRMIGTHTDLTWHKQSEAKLSHMAHFDALTGLPNRNLLQERTERALLQAQRSGKSLALLFLDLDRFKNVNDSLGHAVGDSLLVETGRRLRSMVREQDTVSRLGGDEFILLLPETNADGAAHVAGKLLEALALPLLVNSHELVVTPSVGVAVYPDDGEDFESLLQASDSAMYRAKREGRNNFQFYKPEMHQHTTRILQLENALRRALERDEFSLHYQPQFSVQSGEIIGCEALLRWHSAELGDVAPADFIPVAEDSGLILPIGEWVIRTASQQAMQWQREGIDCGVMAVNLSVVQFRQSHFAEQLTGLLQEAGLQPARFEIELTESTMMDDPDNAVRVMERLHRTGMHVAVDDFGTGYSSLSYLKRFSISRLKIDRSFVHDLDGDADSQAIARAVIALADNLGLRSIAEGVETAEQLAWLREKGCGEAQGFHLAPPMPAADYADWIRARAPAAVVAGRPR